MGDFDIFGADHLVILDFTNAKMRCTGAMRSNETAIARLDDCVDDAMPIIVRNSKEYIRAALREILFPRKLANSIFEYFTDILICLSPSKK